MPSKIRERFKYSEEAMGAAIAAVRGGMAIREAAKQFKVPRATVFDKIKGRTQLGRKIGRDPYLSKTEEDSIVR